MSSNDYLLLCLAFVVGSFLLLLFVWACLVVAKQADQVMEDIERAEGWQP